MGLTKIVSRVLYLALYIHAGWLMLDNLNDTGIKISQGYAHYFEILKTKYDTQFPEFLLPAVIATNQIVLAKALACGLMIAGVLALLTKLYTPWLIVLSYQG